MEEATAYLKNYRQSPRKVRLVADLMRGKSAERAQALLANLPKRASEPLSNLLASAVANAKTKGVEVGELYISSIQVNGGIVFKRSMPRARGRASMIRKKTSHVQIALSRKAAKKAPAAKAVSASN